MIKVAMFWTKFSQRYYSAGGFVVIVEGNLDVIASHQSGVKNVVATAGTALTKDQLKILQRFATDVRLCFLTRTGLAYSRC